MKNQIGMALAVFLLASANASASYVEACRFSAEVKKVERVATLNGTSSSSPESDSYTRLATLQITDWVADRDSHSDSACASKVGRDYQLVVRAGEEYVRGQTLVLDYQYFSGRAPGGFSNSVTWNVVE